jgi:hypothetical protein
MMILRLFTVRTGHEGGWARTAQLNCLRTELKSAVLKCETLPGYSR